MYYNIGILKVFIVLFGVIGIKNAISGDFAIGLLCAILIEQIFTQIQICVIRNRIEEEE